MRANQRLVYVLSATTIEGTEHQRGEEVVLAYGSDAERERLNLLVSEGQVTFDVARARAFAAEYAEHESKGA